MYPAELKGYKFVSIIGKGTYGVVCLYERTGHRIAVKFEADNINVSVITKEALILKSLIGTKGIPRFIDNGMVDYSQKQ